MKFSLLVQRVAKQIVESLYRNGPSTKVQLAARLGVSRPTVQRAVMYLRSKDVELEYDRSLGGNGNQVGWKFSLDQGCHRHFDVSLSSLVDAGVIDFQQALFYVAQIEGKKKTRLREEQRARRKSVLLKRRRIFAARVASID